MTTTAHPTAEHSGNTKEKTMVAKKNIAWGWYAGNEVYPETFISRAVARDFKTEATDYFGGIKVTLSKIQLKPVK